MPIPPSFRFDRPEAKWQTASERRIRADDTSQPRCHGSHLSVGQLRHVGHRLIELLQLFDQLLDAFERTRFVSRHPNLLKALSAPRVS